MCFYERRVNKVDANIFEDDQKIWMTKICEYHGSLKFKVFEDAALYKKWMKFKVTGTPVTYIKTHMNNDYELYPKQLSQPKLMNLMVTNRFNTRSDQNFFDAGITGYVYEPSLDQLRDLMKQTQMVIPLGSRAIQISGGEPTLRDDLLEIIRIVKETGFSHVQIQTNGLRLAESVGYCQELKNEKVDTIYLLFNGITKTTNPFLESHKKVLENCKKVNLNIVLNPILTRDKNLHESGKIVRFAIENSDSIRGVHFELSFQIKNEFRSTKCQEENASFDFSHILQCIEEEYPNFISRDDFYPYCFTFPITKFIEIITNDTQTDSTAHPACGGSTFLFIVDGKPLPLTRFIDVEGFMRFLTEQSKKKGPLRKLRIASSFMKYIDTFVDFNKAPQRFNPKQILKDAAVLGDEYALREFRNKTIFIGFMGFEDITTLDVDRLKRCAIHIPTFEGIFPFCSYHILGYDNQILTKYSIPSQEWEKRSGRDLKDDLR